MVIGADPDAAVYLGFTEQVDPAYVAELVERQDRAALVASLNRLPVAPGDGILVPAGTPHAIGAGTFVVELQEPTDFSVLLEWAGYPLDGPSEGHLGLGYDVALSCLDRSGWAAERLAAVRTRWDREPEPVVPLLPPEAAAFFRADRITPGGDPVPLDAGFAVLIVLDGSGGLETDGDLLPLRRGMTVLVPYAAGVPVLRGEVDVVRCRPADPAVTG